jgi:hypothetical protein
VLDGHRRWSGPLRRGCERFQGKGGEYYTCE